MDSLIAATKEKSAIVSGGGFYKPLIADTSLTWSVVVTFAATCVLTSLVSKRGTVLITDHLLRVVRLLVGCAP